MPGQCYQRSNRLHWNRRQMFMYEFGLCKCAILLFGDVVCTVGPRHTSTATTNPLVTTISGAVESALTSFIGNDPITATFNGRPLLTGTCAQPYFAQATGSTGMITAFPQIGCSHNLDGCCPFDSYQNAVLTRCPQDYSTIASACCPSGWQIYFTDLGGQTPCFTRPTITHIPATTSTVAGLSVITEHVFTRKYDLSDGAIQGSRSLGTGAIAGIAVGGVAGLGVIGALIFFYLRRRKAQKAPQTLATFGGGEGEMVIASPATATAELASPHTLPNSPGSGRSAWISPSSPPAYEHNVDSFRAKARTVAQELPGSTFIFEHHPAYAGQEDQSVTVAPSSPPRTPGKTPPGSPHAKTTSSTQVVSPVGSPLQR
ncbi:hypothetical protein EPUS_02643 [Endocarpon pusillum Z07020]|uniref:Mid2 domain-containing protein n=1 Tax=Endocarpon pusillum (strain Z07020 / HMAS-L-300199) TaxID=1263415 RepID=U1GXR9_ENDPU|nr:uncharacterized protein EPUS_02643 [Endocarpon pusillum Z07020]ERF76931.1 hypothetical protein EPUS_02643 [Endocarpon pusillum Z07020]